MLDWTKRHINCQCYHWGTIIIIVCSIGLTQHFCIHYHDVAFIVFGGRSAFGTIERDMANHASVDFRLKTTVGALVANDASCGASLRSDVGDAWSDFIAQFPNSWKHRSEGNRLFSSGQVSSYHNKYSLKIFWRLEKQCSIIRAEPFNQNLQDHLEHLLVTLLVASLSHTIYN